MAIAKYNTRVLQKHDTKANWDKATNFIPLPGEIIVYDDLKKIKIGDGVTKVGSLAFVQPTPADIGLGNVNNTSDADKPISSATQAALNQKLSLSGGTMTGAIILPTGKDGIVCGEDGGAIVDRYGNLKPKDSSAATWNVYKDINSTKGFSIEWATANVSTTGKFIGNLEGTASNANKLEGYTRNNLYADVHAWIDTVGSHHTIIVEGDKNTYYPVRIPLPTAKQMPSTISIYKNLGSTTPSDLPGNHWDGTSSMWLIYEGRNNYWDGNGGYIKTLYYYMGYANLCAHAQINSGSNGDLIIWLRGGTCSYEICQSGTQSSPTVYYEETDLSLSTFPIVIAPTTDIGNKGIIRERLGFGIVDQAVQDGDGNIITSTYATKTAVDTKFPTAGGTIASGGAIKFNALAASVSTSDPMSITYGRIAAYGTLCINANTDNSGTEYVILTAGKGLSSTATDGLAIGTSTLQWQGQNVIHGGNIGSQSVNYATSAGSATTASKLGTSTQGSSTQPIYLSSGTATTCSTYAGGTAVTLNGASKAASTASFYAPISAGTAGYTLISSGAAPIWSSNLLRSTTYTSSLGFNGASYHTIAGTYAIAAGYYAYAKSSQFVLGHYNLSDTTAGSTSGTMGMAFMIGNGTSSSARANAFYVSYAGVAWAKSSHTNGSDYAEYFEWADGNLNGEDRCGYFVTMENDKIKIASESDYILGVVSGNPSVLGNSADDTWQGRFLTDEFDRPLIEEYEFEEEEEINGEIVFTTKIGTKYKENPDYDSSIHYIQRADRPEWDAVGMVGVLAVRDDGTCQVNGFCKVAKGGIATASTTGYRVIKRVNDHIVKIIFK